MPGENTTTSQPSCSGHVSYEDYERLVRSVSTGGFHFRELILGMVLACCTVAALLWWFRKAASRRLFLHNQTEAVQALKDLDATKLREVMGQVALPAWLNYPDFERTGCVNQVLDQLWPRVSKAINDYYQEQLDPMLKASKPGWIASIKLHKFDLGRKAPQINGIKVYAAGDVQDSIVMDMDFTWAGDQDISLIVKPFPKMLGLYTMIGDLLSGLIMVKVGMEKLIISGRLRVSLKPLMDEIPIVAAAQISLVEMPKMSFEVTLYGGNVTLLPGLEMWLNTFLKDTLVKPYVLPESYMLPFISGDLAIDKPKGMLIVKVKEARNVPKTDWFALSDPFVVLSVRAKDKVQTQVRRFTLNPTWDEEFVIMVHDPEMQKLEAGIFDFETMDSPEEIGRCYVPVKDLPTEEMQDLWLDVHTQMTEDHTTHADGLPAKIKKGMRVLKTTTPKHLLTPHHRPPCQLHLQVTWFKFQGDEIKRMLESEAIGRSPDGQGEAEESTSRACDMLRGGMLYVNVKRASHLVHKPFFKLGFLHTTAKVKVCVAGKKKRTVAVRGQDPSFDEKLEFSLGAHDIADPDLQIAVSVWDDNLLSYCKGTVKVPLKAVMERHMIKETYSLHGVKHGQLSLELQWQALRDQFK
ncbi:hypothetical protein WJX72_000038 [[Myrmecia] bisecta]|uniref:Uncharacterized protein n=1 Tax=[Myrmecia] bisecta TaxID=41462 RepID=A0AAW1Q348_9CHLO